MRYANEAQLCFVEGSALVDLPDPRIGSLVAGRYVIEAVIGEGGMATVYRARHKLVDRLVAVKIMNPMLASDPVVRERFRREARSAQKLAHPNIIEIHDQGDTEDDTAFIVMELLRGEALSAVIARGPMDVDRAIGCMIQIARGIARAHDLEIIHRDIKPENIFICARDDGSDLVKLLDFGIARSQHDSRLTNQGELFGTPQYMAPERILGGETTASSDLYALGVVFFEMLTGALPFEGNDVTSFFIKHMSEPAPSVRVLNPRVPESLADLVAKLLAKTPAERPVDAHRIHQDLLDIIREREMVAPPTADEEEQATQAAGGHITLGAGVVDPWAHRIFVLEQMLARAFGEKGRAPGELRVLLDEANALVHRVEELRRGAVTAQRELEGIDVRGREKRGQLGFAVDQLGVDASKAKQEVRAGRDAQKRAEKDAEGARARYQDAFKEIVIWEGRSGGVEPWPDLALAYRAAADSVDEWNARRAEERRTYAAAETAEQLVTDLDFQIRELRAAIQKHETEIDEARGRCEEQLRGHGAETERLEKQLLELTARFCTPLRTRPELETLFKELEAGASAA
jgi:tRNA A-37 threonylcarbamoyl transferase component Bud32